MPMTIWQQLSLLSSSGNSIEATMNICSFIDFTSSLYFIFYVVVVVVVVSPFARKYNDQHNEYDLV